MKKFIILLIFLLSFYEYVPYLIAEYYFSNTNKKEIKEMSLKYSICVEKDKEKGVLYISGERENLLLWFHIRKIEIDNDHIGFTTMEQWLNLLKYWKIESEF